MAMVMDQQHEQQDHRQHDGQRRHQAQRPTDIEPPQADAVLGLVLAEEDGRDQIAAKHEEQVDADEPTAEMALHRVGQEYAANGDGPDAV